MNKAISTTLIVVLVAVLAGGVLFAGSMFARAYFYGANPIFRNNGYRMMGAERGGYGLGPEMTLAPGASTGVGGYGWNNGTNSDLAPLSVEQAKQAAEKYIQTRSATGLEIGEVMIFDNNAYVSVKESATGKGAFELLVDPVSQVAYPEYGPNMMWNLKYGGVNHGGMMGGYGGMMGGRNSQTVPSANVSAEMPVTAKQAVDYAQKYLDSNFAGAKAATDPTQFYGYYTLDFEKGGKIVGMLSVNGYSGQIFLHTWHGNFIEEVQ
jgi:hypothetical protein